MRKWLYVLSVVLSVSAIAQDERLKEEKPAVEENAWERVIASYEKKDAETPPPADPVLFTGSSSIVMWKLSEAFPEWPVLNRGFGGSKFADLNHFFERVVLRYKPRVLVVYSGDNDLASNLTADEVFTEFKKFADRVRAELPQTKVVVIGIKPSKARWHLWRESQKVNEQMKSYASEHGLRYVDLGDNLLNDSGDPNPDYFAGDRLHLNAEGYEMWTKELRPVLEELLK